MENDQDFQYEGRLLLFRCSRILSSRGYVRGRSRIQQLGKCFCRCGLIETYYINFLDRLIQPSRVAVFEIHTRQELVMYLQSAPPDMTYAAFDSDGAGKFQIALVEMTPLSLFLSNA